MNNLQYLPEIAAKYHTARVLEPENLFGTHDYMPVYQALLSGRPVRKILEIGIGPKGLHHEAQPAGCGLLMWAECFPEAEVYGLDFNPDTLVNDGRIHSFLCDQGSAWSLQFNARRVGREIDFIVDDASHKPDDQILSAHILLPFLSVTGVYVIEDVLPGGECSRRLQYPHRTIELRVDQVVDDRLIIIEAKDCKYDRALSSRTLDRRGPIAGVSAGS